MRRAAAVWLASAALITAEPAAAHVTPVPSFAPAGETTRVRLTGPNERSAPMTGFAVKAPEGVAIVHAHPSGAWAATVDGPYATWSGSTLAAAEAATFEVDLAVDPSAEPGAVRLAVEQRYRGDKVVRWPVAVTITPGKEPPSENLAAAALVAVLGLAAVTVVAVVLLARRTRPLSES